MTSTTSSCCSPQPTHQSAPPHTMIKLKSLFRRGPSGPSSSKQQAAAAAAASTSSGNALNPNPSPAPHLKGSSSVSSLDHVGLASKASAAKSHKHHGSKDRLIDAKLSKGASREKLAASRESLDVKESKHQQRQQRAELQQQLQQQQQQQMSLVQQQQQHQQQHVSGNNNLIDGGGGYAGMVDPLTKELTDINFDGPREVRNAHARKKKEFVSLLKYLLFLLFKERPPAFQNARASGAPGTTDTGKNHARSENRRAIPVPARSDDAALRDHKTTGKCEPFPYAYILPSIERIHRNILLGCFFPIRL